MGLHPSQDQNWLCRFSPEKDSETNGLEIEFVYLVDGDERDALDDTNLATTNVWDNNDAKVETVDEHNRWNKYTKYHLPLQLICYMDPISKSSNNNDVARETMIRIFNVANKIVAFQNYVNAMH